MGLLLVLASLLGALIGQIELLLLLGCSVVGGALVYRKLRRRIKTGDNHLNP